MLKRVKLGTEAWEPDIANFDSSKLWLQNLTIGGGGAQKECWHGKRTEGIFLISQVIDASNGS